VLVPPPPETAFLTAKEACRLLDVKAATLYAYVSRGLLRTSKGRGPRGEKLYPREDIERLAKRRDARRGHAAVAGAALAWGEPVLDSSITAIGAEGPRYRGYLATDLARAGHPFESVVHLLREGALPPDGPLPPLFAGLPAGLRGDAVRPLDRASELLGRWIADGRESDDEAWSTPATLPWIVRPSGFPRAEAHTSTAERVLTALRRTASTERLGLVDAALVLVADHELNVSTFTARVVASSGASLVAAVAAAVHALSGAAHGGMCERVERMVTNVGVPGRARATVRDAIMARRELPGFGHPLYPSGDPRTPPLLTMAAAAAGKSQKLDTLFAIVRAAREEGLEPTVDLGLVAVSFALGAPAGTATALFAIGRSAGWLAHAEEQRSAGALLRPRARYVGEAARATPPRPRARPCP